MIGYMETYMVESFPPEHVRVVPVCENMVWHPSYCTKVNIDATCKLDDFMCRYSEYNRVRRPEMFEEKCHRKEK